MSSQSPCQGDYCFAGANAVDGVKVPPGGNQLASLAETLSQNNAWMRIDLEENHCISAVKIWNKTPTGKSQLNSFLKRPAIQC